MSDFITAFQPLNLLVPNNANENTLYRLRPFVTWCEETNHNWLIPDLQEYGEHLQQRMSNRSINAHLGSIRSAYRTLMRNNDFRRQLLQHYTVEEVNEWQVQLSNAIHPDTAKFKEVVDQDAENRVRLTQMQVTELLSQPDRETLKGLRDDALIRFMLSTGVREAESVKVTLDDLHSYYEGMRAVLIAEGKGAKSRLVPYEKLEAFFMPQMRDWLQNAGINEGAIFRGIHRSGLVRDTALNKRSVEFILAQYPISHNNESYVVKPHDLRATYARQMRIAGEKLDAIQQNMGHRDIKTTLGYIGDLDARSRDFSNPYDG